jgi:hypothetical protein
MSSNIQYEVKKGIVPVVVFLAMLIISGMTAAASIETEIKTAVISAATLVELYLFLYMIDRV